jgi:hypothetical protein
LLEGEIPVDGEAHVELASRQTEQLAIVRSIAPSWPLLARMRRREPLAVGISVRALERRAVAATCNRYVTETIDVLYAR